MRSFSGAGHLYTHIEPGLRLLRIPYHLFYPVILVFMCIGAYTISNGGFDVFLLVATQPYSSRSRPACDDAAPGLEALARRSIPRNGA